VPIERGKAWGSSGELPKGAPVAESDAEAAQLFSQAQIIGLHYGDLARTLGVRPGSPPSATQQLLPIDVVSVQLDEAQTFRAVAHVQIGYRWRQPPFVALMNAAFIGDCNLAPRAHPGDGKIDVVTMSLRPADRIKAWRRMATASHLPHPDIRVERRTGGTVEFGRALPVLVDGKPVGKARSVTYSIEPEPLIVAV